MRSRSVHRLYVRGAEAAPVGTLSCTDVVTLRYRYCRACPKSISHRASPEEPGDEGQRLTVKEVMTPSVVSFAEDAALAQVIEGLTAHRFGAALICSGQAEPRGVISKTDLIRAYHHGMSLEAEAGTIMTAPVVAWDQSAFLWEALRQMVLKDAQRLFVHAGDPGRITGVLSLSDAARVRSGSCRACIMPSRFMVPA